MTNALRLREFILALADLLDGAPDEATILGGGASLLGELLRHDDWLSGALAAPDPVSYRQNLLHCESRERFSVVSFVWGPGQKTPIHNHTVWGLVGVLRGAELNQRFRRLTDGGLASDGEIKRLEPGAVVALSPSVGDIHRVSNAFSDRTSISIHVYGANIGGVERAVFDETGASKSFVSGYSNALLPNIWDHSATATHEKRA
jgi:predicted metal-dependent enzyme (double-stranded beta helix superfamily)